MKLTSGEKDSSISRIKNRCVETGRSRGIISAYRVSRLRFREYMKMGLIRLLAKATCVTVSGSKRVFEILSVFEAEGLIRGFQILDIQTNKVSIYLKYKQDMTSLLSRMRAVSVNKEKLYLRGKVLTRLNPRVNMYLIESKFGLNTLSQFKLRNKQLQYPIGGEIKYIVEINKVNLKLQEGVLAGFCIEIKLVGLGYMVHKVGNTLVFDTGYSHYRSCLIPVRSINMYKGTGILGINEKIKLKKGKSLMLSGNVASLKGNTLLKSQEKQILEILQSFKGLYDYTYGLKVEALDKIRRLENVYRYIRVIKGYPIKGRTKSNANTAKRQASPGGNKKLKIMDILKKKPTNRKERRIFNKIKKLQDKHNKQQQKT
ncbi:hypothetical protein ACTFIU_002005 [Dictyostelium citrinum]